MRDLDVFTLFGACTVMAVVGNSAQAAIHYYTLDIARESLDAALKAFAHQTGLQIARLSDVGNGDILVGPVSGNLTSAQALSMLLSDSGLTYRVLNDRTIAIVKQRDVPDANRIGPPAARAPSDDANTGDRERGGFWSGSRAAADHQGNISARKARESPSSFTQLEEVVVRGIRASLQRSLDVKQEAVGVVDAVSASDIGNFPDASLGEAMQRVPGVTVTRTMMSGLGSGAELFAGSPSTITVRGFGGDFAETLIDGRPQASAAGRAFDFATLGADFATEVGVHKTPDFTISSGAVGATVNIKFPQPFDNPGLQARALGSETVTTNDGSFHPGFGALFSETFFDDTLGILLDGDWSDTRVDSHHLDVVAWNGTHLNSCQMAGGPVCVDSDGKRIPYSSLILGSGAPYIPANARNTFPSWYVQDYALYNDRTDDRRKDGRAVLQWRPTDTVLVTLDDNYSDDWVSSFRSEYSVWFNGSAIYDVRQDANGTITDFSYGPAPTDLNESIQGSYIKNNTVGVNVQWDLSDSLSATLDADQSASHLNPGGAVSSFNVDIGYGPGTTIGGAPPSADYLALAAAGFPNSRYGGVIIPSNTNDTLPIQPTYSPSGQSGNVLGMTPSILGSHVLPIVSQYGSDYVNQAKLDIRWSTGKIDLHGGLQFVEDTRNSRSYNSFTNYAWLLWAGYGPASANAIGRALPASLFANSGYINTSNFFPGFSNNSQLPPIPLYNPYVVYDYLQRQPANPGTIGGPNPPSCVAGSLGCYTLYSGGPEPVPLQPESISFVQEKSYSPFVTLQQKLTMADLPLTANVGLRYERTVVSTSGVGRLPTELKVDPLNPNVFAIQYTPLTYLRAQNQYSYLLPSLDLNLFLESNLKVRLDASRTLTRPPLNEITPTVTASGFVGALTATSNNPALLPYLASNFDLGVEWYYGANEYLAVDTFFKHVTQFPEQQTRNVTINNAQDPTTGTTAVWAETQFENARSADVYGAEISWQQMLIWGFGYQINGTLVQTDRPYDRFNLGTRFYLPGLADSANFVGFFQNRGFQARLAVNWTGEQLISTVQEQAAGEFGNEPVFTRPFTQVDFSVQYDVTDNLNVFFKALNLSNSEIIEHGRFDNQILNVQDYGRTFTFGVRAKL
jgi:iron complex outermembrane recepter protein